MSIALLKTLIAVADQGSFSAAAEATNVSQAAVGQQMRRLEESLHVTLFDRGRKSPQLNPLARALLPKARDLVFQYDTLLDDLTGDAQLHGELIVGAVPSTIRALVPLSIKALVRSYPQLLIRVVPGLTSDLQEQVERGAVDVAILSEPNSIPEHLRWQPFVIEQLILLTSPEVAVDDPLVLLQQKPYIRHTRRASVGLLADQWLSDHGIALTASMEMESIESLTSMVFHNLGVSIVPDVCVPDSIFAGLRKIPLPEPVQKRVLGVLTRADCSRLRLIDRLVEQLHLTVEHYSSDGLHELADIKKKFSKT